MTLACTYVWKDGKGGGGREAVEAIVVQRSPDGVS